MRQESKVRLGAGAGKSFDVICAGEALVHLSAPGGALSAKTASLRLRPGGGALHAALAIARRGMRVGLATALGDDTFGRALIEKIAAAGVDVGGISLAVPRTGLVFVTGAGVSSEIVAYREEERPFAVPANWSAQVLLLSGLTPVVSHGASLCKAARAARKTGSVVVIDVNARQHAWMGRDSRAIRSVLREADVVRCSAEDLSVLGLDEKTVRDAMRRASVLVTRRGTGETFAMGPFGEVAVAPKERGVLRPMGAGDAFTAAMCAELAKAGDAAMSGDAWTRALQRGEEAARVKQRS